MLAGNANVRPADKEALSTPSFWLELWNSSELQGMPVALPGMRLSGRPRSLEAGPCVSCAHQGPTRAQTGSTLLRFNVSCHAFSKICRRNPNLCSSSSRHSICTGEALVNWCSLSSKQKSGSIPQPAASTCLKRCSRVQVGFSFCYAMCVCVC